MADLVFSQKDNGALVEVSLGSKVTIELPENPTTGYQWIIETADEVFLVSEGDAFLTGNQIGLSAGGVRRFYFRAKGIGCTSASFTHKSGRQSSGDTIGKFKLALRILK